MRRLEWVKAPNPAVVPDSETPALTGPAATPLIVAPYGMEQDPGLTGMIGAKYPLTMRWDPASLPALPEADATSSGLAADELARLQGRKAWGRGDATADGVVIVPDGARCAAGGWCDVVGDAVNTGPCAWRQPHAAWRRHSCDGGKVVTAA